jgi:hypothetical protein
MLCLVAEEVCETLETELYAYRAIAQFSLANFPRNHAKIPQFSLLTRVCGSSFRLGTRSCPALGVLRQIFLKSFLCAVVVTLSKPNVVFCIVFCLVAEKM